MSFSRSRSLVNTSLAAVFLAIAPASAMAQETTDFSRYEAFDEDSNIRIDYTAFDDILGGLVFEVGRSDRMPGRGGAAVRTGTRINLANTSRYRYEANRIVLHALNDEQRDVISAYRQELESLPAAVDLSRLSSNEQLAYWLNLHNLVVIDELAREYPISNLNRWRIDGVPYADAKIINVNGQRLSLNDIRFNIVGANWDDSRVMYGFFSGAVGGPTLQGEAFTGARVWSELNANAREFVNSLRGVEDARFGFRISPMFEEWRDIYFADWPQDLRLHLNAFAETQAGQTIGAGSEPNFLRYDWSVADLTNGVGQCGGAGTFNVQSSSNEMGLTGQRPCGTLPAHAQEFVGVVFERRLEFLRSGRMGSVTIRDIETDDEGERPGRRVDLNGEEIDDEPSR